MKLSNEKFRFHISTLEHESSTVILGGNNYDAEVYLTYHTGLELQNTNSRVTEYLLQICEELHHKVVIPANSPFLIIENSGSQVNVNCIGTHLHYSFPKKAAVLCQIENTTISDLSMYVAKSLEKLIIENCIFPNDIEKFKLKILQNIGPLESTTKIRLANN